jgi:hypothetical protein
MNDNISESEKQDYLAAQALDEDWSEAKCAEHGVSEADLERARRMKAAGQRAVRDYFRDDSITTQRARAIANEGPKPGGCDDQRRSDSTEHDTRVAA